MKNFLKIVFVFLAIVVVAMLVIGKKYHYEKSIVINAPVEKVWQNVNSMKAVNSWSPFLDYDKNMKQTYSGVSGQVGDTYHWSGNDEAGEGEEKITALEPNKKSSVNIRFIKPFEGNADADVILESQGNATKVTWTFNTEMNYPMNLMKLTMDSQMDKDFGKGLQKLKEISEK